MILDAIERAAIYRPVGPRIAAALDYLADTDFSRLAPGRYELDGTRLFALVQRYRTKPLNKLAWEAHRRYIDVQYVVEGVERIGYAPLRPSLAVVRPYDAEKDIVFYDAAGDLLNVPAGSFMILGPYDLHAPGLVTGTPPIPVEVCKVVVKCAVE